MRVRIEKLARPIPVTRVEAKKLIESMSGVPMAPMEIDSTRPLRRDMTGPVRTTAPPTHPVRGPLSGELLDFRDQPAKSLIEGVRVKMPMTIKLDDGDRLRTSPVTKVDIDPEGEDALVTTESNSFYKICVKPR